MFMSLYTNKTKSILTEQRFLKLISILEQKQETHRKRFQNLILLGKIRKVDGQNAKKLRSYITLLVRYPYSFVFE